jgi:tetratricopeptide (TPR) repeat protein
MLDEPPVADPIPKTRSVGTLMNAQKIRAALGQLQDDPDHENSWNELFEAVTSPKTDISPAELRTLLEAARRGHEVRREWDAVGRLLELEIGLHAGTPVEFAMQFELARVFEDEMFDDAKATAAYKRLLQLRPDDPTALEALERRDTRRRKWKELVARYLEEAAQATDEAFKSSLLMSASDAAYRYGDRTKKALTETAARLEEALALDPKNHRVGNLLERIYRDQENWPKLAHVLGSRGTDAFGREERAASLIRLARLQSRKLNAADDAALTYERALQVWPGNSEAMNFLSEHFSKTERWDQLVALYEEQLRGGGARPGEEAGILFQIAMVNWRMRKRPDLAEPYFDRLRRFEPAHRGMLDFFREFCLQANERTRLVSILTDAQRSVSDPAEKTALATEIAKLAEAGGGAQKAIDQYKAILRADPNNHDARQALKRLYTQAESWNALIEMLRQDLERGPADDKAARLVVLREIAAVYRTRIKSDTALVTVLTQIVQLDNTDAPALRELVRVYESLGRWRDLLQHQASLAALLPDGNEKAELYRTIARRWLEQFSNAQNATDAYESLLAAAPSDEEAVSKLRELYAKRRAWPALYALFERQAEAKSGPPQIELLGEMAKIAAERLDRGADAIRLYQRILTLDPRRLDVLDLLERQAERDKDYAMVAWALERRLELADADAARLAVLQKLGGVYADRLADHAGATKTWRRVLAIQPGHPKALRVLRDSYLTSGDYDGLEELYGSQNDWEGLAEVLSGAADRAIDPDAKVDLSFRTARVLTDKIGAKERAFRSYERILSVRQEDATAAAALVEIYESEEKWARLPPLYEILLGSSQDDDWKLELLQRLVEVTGQRLGDRAAAVEWAFKAYDLSPTEQRLDQLEHASRAAKSWDFFVQAIGARLKKKKGVPLQERRRLRAKLARVQATELGRIDDAIGDYRALVEEDPADEDAVAALDRLLRSENRRDDLRWLFELRAGEGTNDARAAILTEWASLEQDAFGEPARATDLYRRVLQADPGNELAARTLPRLLLTAGNAEEAAQVIETHRERTEGQTRADHDLDLSDIYLDHLSRPAEALTAAARALETVPHCPRAVAMLERLIALPPTRAKAAELLRAEYAEANDPRRQAQALAVLLETTTEKPRRLELYIALAEIEEHKLSAAGRAFDVVLKGLLEFPEHIELWDRAGALSARAARPIDLADAYRTALRSNADLPSDIEVELCERAAVLHDEKLGDSESATPYLERILDKRPGDERAFGRLKQILTSAEKWGELEGLYARTVRGTTDATRRVDLLNEVALVCEEIINEPVKAIGYYEAILELDPEHYNASRALEQLYGSEARYGKLAALLERRLANAASEDIVALKVRLGQIHLDQLHEPAKALGHLEEVLRLEVSNGEARRLVERILDIGSLRARAAFTLETVYEARDEVRDLVRVLEIRLEGADGVETRRELLQRIAALRDERLRDDPGALDALSRLVPLDPTDMAARDRLTEIGKRLGAYERVATVLSAAAEAAEAPALRSEILMSVAELYEVMLGDHLRAEAVYKAALAIEPNDAELALPPARALERLYAGSGKHAELAGMLVVEVDLEQSVDRRRELLARLGELAETVLEDPSRAISAWRKRLDDDAHDERALVALERLYQQTGHYRELVDVLRAREKNANTADARRAIMVKIAETLADKLDDKEEAIAAFCAVEGEFGPDKATLASLESLYEATQNYAELAEALDADLGLSEDPRTRIELLARLGQVRMTYGGDWAAALDALRQALLLDPSHGKSRAAIELLLDHPEARREASETLHPLYEADGDNDRLLRVLEIEVASADSSDQRLRLLEQATGVAELRKGDPPRAFAYAVQGVREAAAEPEITRWLETAHRLAAATGSYRELIELERAVLPNILDEDVQLDTSLRIAELARIHLADRELARMYYKRALDLRGEDRRALSALESLYEEMGDGPALLEILKRRVDIAESEGEKKELLFRQAHLSAESLGDEDAAIAVYESILDLSLEPLAISELEKLYRGKSRFRDLVALYERQLDHGGEAAADLHVKIAVIAREHLSDVDRAFDELAHALDGDDQHAGAIAELETILKDGDDRRQRARAAEMLEPVYQRRAAFPELMGSIEARLESTDDPDERRPLLRRLAVLQEEQGEDYNAALETFAKLLHDDVADEANWIELERLAKVAGAEKRLSEVYAAELGRVHVEEAATAKLARRTGELFAKLGDMDRALRFLRRAHEFEPESAPLFSAIDELLIRDNRPRERVELYQAALDYRYDPRERIHTLHTIADLERTALRDLDRAIETYRAILDIEEDNAKAEDELTALYRTKERHQDLAELYERRAEQAPNPAAAAVFRLSLARLYRDQLDNLPAAIDQYEQIVLALPDHAEATADLEALTDQGDHKARIIDILRPLYERADDWRHLVKLNQQRLELVQSRADKIPILRENAELWEKRGKDDARALEALRTAFELDPDDENTREELERVAGKIEAWDTLARAYEKGIENADPLVKRQLLSLLAVLHDQKRDDPRQALAAYERLFSLDETDSEPLDQMDQLATLLSDWVTVVKILNRKVDLVVDDGERASLLRRVGETKRDMLEDPHGAIIAYERALELDPESTFTLDSLIELYERGTDHRTLVELYRRRFELASPEEHDLKFKLVMDAAELLEKHLDEPREAIDCLRQAAAQRPSEPAVLRALYRLFRAEQMWTDLLENLGMQAAFANTQEERVRLRKEIGSVYAERLDDPVQALDAYRSVLDEAPGDAEAIAAVHRIGEDRDDLSLLASEILEPVLRAGSQFEKLAAVLEMRVRAQGEPFDRAATLKAIAKVVDGSLGRPGDAEDVLLRALSETADDPDLYREIDRLAAVAQGYARYADVLEERASAIFDGAVSQDLLRRLGKIAELELKDDRRAIRAYAKANEQAGDDPEILASLDRLYERTKDYRSLLDVLERRVTVEPEAKKQAELLYRQAHLQIQEYDERSPGLATLKQALERDPDHGPSREALEALTEDATLFEEAAEALEAVYRAKGDDQRLVALYEKRIAFAGSPRDRTRIRLDLGKLLEDSSRDPKRAQSVLEDALGDDPTDVDVLGEIERLAARNGWWPSATSKLEAAVLDAKDLSADAARDVYIRLSSWYEEHLRKPEAAEQALEKALDRDPENVEILRSIERIRRAPGRERDLVQSLRRLAELELDPVTKRELFREAKELAEDKVKDPALTEEVLRQLLLEDEANGWALEELTRLEEAKGAWRAVLELLLRRAELSADGLDVSRLSHQAAEIASKKLGDVARAVELYETIFENTPTDVAASAALRELYAQNKQHRDLARLLERLIEVATTPGERTQLRLELAQLQSGTSTDDAVDTLKSVLDEEPTSADAVLLLSQLYEKAGRDEDLAALLESQIELAKERRDDDAELALTVRLGDVYESRLGDMGRAIDTYQAVLGRSPAHRGALESLARLFEAKGELPRAAEVLEKLLEQSTGQDAVKLAIRLSELFTKLKDERSAERALERGLAQEPTHAEIRKRLAQTYERTREWGRLAELIAADADASPLAAEKVRLYRSAAQLYIAQQNDPASAAGLLEKASGFAPQDRELLLALCDAYTAAGRSKEAASALEKVVASFAGKRSKELAAIHQRLSQAYLADGDKTRALAELDQAFKIDPGSVAVLRDLGRLSIELGDLDRAQKSYRALLLQKLDRSSPISKGEVFLRLGEISNRQGDKAKAVQMLERALENEPNLASAKNLLAELKR